MIEKDFLWRNIRDLPYFRGALRAVESRFYQEFEFVEPILDLGCGDGQFVTVTFDTKINVGVDPWTGPVREAVRRGGYHHVIQNEGALLPFENSRFNTVFSNSVLEHIPDLQPVIDEISRVLKPEGMFYFCVPNHQFLSNLSIARFFDKIGVKFAARWYRNFFNYISRHHHCDSPETWQRRLEAAGFEVVKWWHYFSPRALATLEWGHYFGLPAWIIHAITGEWILVKKPWNLALTRKIVSHSYEEDAYNQPLGAYTFYIAQKHS
jgi:SAM-dependent methyltransferase